MPQMLVIKKKKSLSIITIGSLHLLVTQRTSLPDISMYIKIMTHAVVGYPTLYGLYLSWSHITPL